MTLRSRVLISSAFLVLLPLILLALLIRAQISSLLTGQFEQRLAALDEAVVEELAAREGFVQDRLRALRSTLADDNRFRQALYEGEGAARTYLLDYGERVMPVLGLAMLQIRDARGSILTSGHFRGEHGGSDPELYKLVRAAAQESGAVLGRVRTATSPFLALLAADSLTMGGRRLCLVGGVRVDEALLRSLAGRGGGVVTLAVPPQGSAPGSEVLSSDPEAGRGYDREHLVPGHLARTRATPFIRAIEPRAQREGAAASRTDAAQWVVSQPLAPLAELRSSLERGLLIVLVASAAGMLAVAAWLSARVTRPLEDLARRTAAIDLDHLQLGFETRRDDEVGALARLLAAMTDRLRGSAEKLREAERRATLGEMARQINHDIRNGLAPIRNIVRHMSQIVTDAPDHAAAVFQERQPALESSVSYLESLADNYARISVHPTDERCDPGAIAREVVAGMRGREGVSVHAIIAPDLAAVRADPVGLRRILENLVRNACESLAGRPGQVRVLADNAADEDGQPGVRLIVSDNGPGIPRETLSKIFQDFYTTKEHGAGLGLSIVRRLVADFRGRVRADSVPGEGATFTVWLPAARQEDEEPWRRS